MELDFQDQPTLRKLARIAALDLRIHRDVMAKRNIPVEPTRTADMLTLDRERELQARVDWLDRMLDATHSHPLPKDPTMTDAQIKDIVSRFLAWKLPDNFQPDCGISFKREFNENTPHPMKHEPTGTNLLDATQAEAMVRHILALPTA